MRDGEPLGSDWRWGEAVQRVAPPGRLTPTQWLQRVVVLVVFTSYALTVLSTLAVVFLLGLQVLDLPDDVRNWIGPSILGEAVSSAALVIAYLFRRQE